MLQKNVCAISLFTQNMMMLWYMIISHGIGVRNAMNDDKIFITSCINSTIANKIQRPTTKKWGKLAKQILQFQICINDS